MGKIESYPQAAPVEGTDLLIGTDVNASYATKNFTVSSLGEFIAASYTGTVSVYKKITPAEIVAMSASPVELVAAPGANKIIWPTEMFAFYKFATAAYTVAGGTNFQISTSGAGINWINSGAVGFLDQVQNMWITQAGSNYIAQSADLINKSLVAGTSIAVTNPGLSASELIIKLTYMVIDV